MKRIHFLVCLILVIGCSSDNNSFEEELESIDFSCCGPNPFEDTNVDNLDQSRGEIQLQGLITPNNDGINDFWIVNNLELYENFTLQIFDINGNLVFEADENSENFGFTESDFRSNKNSVFEYKLVIVDEATYLNQGYFCSFTGPEKRSAGNCTTVFRDPILE
ncbi:T9SS type B sorting domain-containing protein [Muricauda sp. JGD-17]|uniref:T9SS type B sorting domain-containing protein n=1 Tax=Flagellimonas ochracea TaxID=2696472 RepID=A0A964WXJ1_9FLAO|nr:gliding motility-associated C-terminal domain-containing protein [Allomuricauda ochracea]NAY92110.1 T9SS type B sorting domain-containing protein [Allomuricauda ochracea]